MRAIGQRYFLKVAPASDAIAARVEVLLVDTAFDISKKWLSKEMISKMPKLKLIQSTRAGVDSVDFDNIPNNITVCGNIGAYSDQIAEHAFGMILYFARNIGISLQNLKNGVWEIPKTSIFLKGKTIGVVGAGGIGQACARLAKCFEMRTLGVNTSGKPARNFDRTFKLGNSDYIFSNSDVIVIATPLSVKTFHLIDSRRLRQMKDNCILINVARGFVIDEKALFEHLKEHPNFRAGLDVWWRYPTGAGEKFSQDYPFFELPNFLGTPHDSGIVPETEEIAVLSAIGNIERFMKGRPLKGVTDRSHYEGLKRLIARARREA